MLQLSYLEGLGIPSQSICNMASMVPKILGVEESTAKELVEFLKGRGLNGKLPEPIPTQGHPNILRQFMCAGHMPPLRKLCEIANPQRAV